MFNALLIASNHLRFGPLQRAAVESQQLLILRSFDRYPLVSEFERLLRSVPPDVILLDLDDHEQAVRLAEMTHAGFPEIAIIGMDGDDAFRLNIAANGILHVLPFPCEPEDVSAALDTAIHAVDSAPAENLFTFLPAKAGNGCTTIAVHTALALARQSGGKTLLLEADLRSGTIQFQIDAPCEGSIQNVLAAGVSLDHFHWDRNLINYQGLHMLLTNGQAPAHLPGWRDYHGLLRLARPKYRAILVDLPELVNPGTAELVRRSQNVYLVCNQDFLSLKLATRRLQELSALGIRMEKVHLLVSRWRSREVSRPDIARMLKHPVAAVFPEDSSHLRGAMRKSELASLDSPIGAACTRFAETLSGAHLTGSLKEKMSNVLHSLIGR